MSVDSVEIKELLTHANVSAVVSRLNPTRVSRSPDSWRTRNIWNRRDGSPSV